MALKNEKRSATITDVAREAEVSISTVSRVLNNPEIVQEETREKVEKAIRKMNFIPNSFARGLGLQGIRTVAVVVPNIINSCMAEMVRGAMDVFREAGIDTLLFNSNEDPEMERRHYQYLTENMIHGVIFITNCGAQVDFGRIAGSMPVVLIDRDETHPLVDNFIVEDSQGMEELYYHLRSLGHRNIGMLGGKKETEGSQRRVEAFAQLLEEEGREFSDKLIVYSDWNMKGGKQGLLKLLDRYPEVTAVICNSDILAIGALSTAYEKNLRVPDDIAVVGFDNFPESEYAAPSLTTLEYPHYLMGRQSAQAVIDRFRDWKKPGEYISYPLKLKIRNSSMPLY